MLTAPGHRPTQRRVLNSVGLSNAFALSLCLCSFHFSEMLLVSSSLSMDTTGISGRCRPGSGVRQELGGNLRGWTQDVSQGGKQPQADGDKWTCRED